MKLEFDPARLDRLAANREATNRAARENGERVAEIASDYHHARHIADDLRGQHARRYPEYAKPADGMRMGEADSLAQVNAAIARADKLQAELELAQAHGRDLSEAFQNAARLHDASVQFAEKHAIEFNKRSRVRQFFASMSPV